MNTLAAKRKGRPESGRGEYYRKYINREKLDRLEKRAKKTGTDPKSLIDAVLEQFLETLR